jgi:hypothetical protein
MSDYWKIEFKIGKLKFEIHLCFGIVFGIAWSPNFNIIYISIGPFVIIINEEK